MKFVLVLIIFGWIAIFPAPALGTDSAQGRPFDLAQGRQAYEANCARCHGPTGAGDGLDAKRMIPRPRRLSEGIFKFRTTAGGTPPTDLDLFRTISTGLPGSRMPDSQRLSEETRWNLVAYLKSLSPVFQSQTPEPIDLGKDPGRDRADLNRGKELYRQLGCAACHGELGRGNGPSAATLADNWGQPIRAADLTQGWNYRGGSGPREIVARVMSGIDGTPMPSYVDALSKEEAWPLAYYVQSLQEEPNFRRTVEAVRMDQPLPTDLEDPRWKGAASTRLPLSSNLYQQGEILPTTATAISVQAVYNEEAILFRLVWHDPSENRGVPADAIGLLLVPDRRLKLRIGSVRSWPAGPDAPALDLTHWSADSSAADASYASGRWTVLMRRPLIHRKKGPILLGIMVWDGGNAEQGRRRANSHWVDLILKEDKL